MDLAEPWPLPANPALASIVSEFEALGSCATFFDAEWFYVYGPASTPGGPATRCFQAILPTTGSDQRSPGG